MGELASTDASVKGAVTLAAGGARLQSGASITAGPTRASLRLERGGQLDVCPRSSLSISASANGRELMLALGTGALEVHYPLTASADTILTPDFRLMLVGPGEFHFAISADVRGATCVRSLPGDTASVIVYEQMGDGIYQVRPGGQVLFHDGTVKDPGDLMPPGCGCPAPPPNQPAQIQPQLIPSFPRPEPAETKPAPAQSDVRIEVDAPLVFRATEPDVPPPPMIARLESRSLPSRWLVVKALPPPVVAQKPTPKSEQKPEQKKGLMQRLHSFFGAIFHSS